MVTIALEQPGIQLPSELQPRRLNRPQLPNDSELEFQRILAGLGIQAHHEQWFYPFWIEQTLRGPVPHGFRVDYTFRYQGTFMAAEVCVADLYPTRESMPPGSNTRKWKPPHVKLADKHDKIEALWDMHRVPCALVTGKLLQRWRRLLDDERSTAVHALLGSTLRHCQLAPAA